MRRLIPLLALPILLAGCATTKPPTVNALARYESVARIATYTAASIWLIDKPEVRVHMANSRSCLAVSLAQTNFDGVMLAACITQQLPIDELQSQKARVIIGGAMMIYQEAVRNSQVEFPLVARAFGNGVVQGLDAALAVTP